MGSTTYHRWVFLAVILAFIVIMQGAYTRHSDAGLGCPDWPTCYGKLTAPTPAKLNKTTIKSWIEMIHRYSAGVLGFIIISLCLWASLRKFRHYRQPLLVPWLLLGIVVLQVFLGKWTVTMKLLPIVVTGHLLGGMTVISLLWWLSLATKSSPSYLASTLQPLRPWAVLALFIVAMQIFLGAWTSTNYAALACPDFPFCQGTLLPHLDWKSAFNFNNPVGPNYEGGRLAMNARVTIQMVHRYGAMITAAYLIPFVIVILSVRRFAPLRNTSWAILFVLCAQVTLGILNIVLKLPTWTAIAHNGFAALLLISIITLLYKLKKESI